MQFIFLQTIAVTQNFISCRLAKHFDAPDEFIPERWLKSSSGSKSSINPYLVLPFSHGMRSCIARRFAEQNMLVLMIRVRIETGTEIKFEYGGFEEKQSFL